MSSLHQLDVPDVRELVFDGCLNAHTDGLRTLKFDFAHSLLHLKYLQRVHAFSTAQQVVLMQAVYMITYIGGLGVPEVFCPARLMY